MMTNEEAALILTKLIPQARRGDSKSITHTNITVALLMGISALIQKPKTGRWIYKNDNSAIPTGYYQCSKCHSEELLHKDNFCR